MSDEKTYPSKSSHARLLEGFPFIWPCPWPVKVLFWSVLAKGAINYEGHRIPLRHLEGLRSGGEKTRCHDCRMAGAISRLWLYDSDELCACFFGWFPTIHIATFQWNTSCLPRLTTRILSGIRTFSLNTRTERLQGYWYSKFKTWRLSHDLFRIQLWNVKVKHELASRWPFRARMGIVPQKTSEIFLCTFVWATYNVTSMPNGKTLQLQFVKLGLVKIDLKGSFFCKFPSSNQHLYTKSLAIRNQQKINKKYWDHPIEVNDSFA